MTSSGDSLISLLSLSFDAAAAAAATSDSASAFLMGAGAVWSRELMAGWSVGGMMPDMRRAGAGGGKCTRRNQRVPSYEPTSTSSSTSKQSTLPYSSSSAPSMW